MYNKIRKKAKLPKNAAPSNKESPNIDIPKNIQCAIILFERAIHSINKRSTRINRWKNNLCNATNNRESKS